MTVWCARCRKHRPASEFQAITPQKVVDEQGRQVRYAKHVCGWKTMKRVAQPAGKRVTIAAT